MFILQCLLHFSVLFSDFIYCIKCAFSSTVSLHQSQGRQWISELIQMVLLQDMSVVSKQKQGFIVYFSQF